MPSGDLVGKGAARVSFQVEVEEADRRGACSYGASSSSESGKGRGDVIASGCALRLRRFGLRCSAVSASKFSLRRNAGRRSPLSKSSSSEEEAEADSPWMEGMSLSLSLSLSIVVVLLLGELARRLGYKELVL